MIEDSIKIYKNMVKARTQDCINYQKEIERLNKALLDIKEYINFLVIFNQNINGKFSETIWGEEILDFINEALDKGE